ncbi:molybdopterin synthase catalytic subunit MoaE [Marinospirillum sp.]|uniref:molybdopterin synthase catalytic subunit MoaE n=1 Tax=Marinospirillum sp. TaxID=2183934 RepID=UPI0028707775|nr:molybdopterin synthase catalytic subunit MoaE [Marinospirillum sp.]MDR9468703.1 molybdopterin synthase catalytic subunit MoaE [Marinospirillum sp.]
MNQRFIRVQRESFDTGKEVQLLADQRTDIGAVVSFTGYVRDFNEKPEVTALTLEHYPGMTEQALEQIALEAEKRWELKGLRILHRIGRMEPGDPIVLVVTASAHRQDAFDACNFIMDFLKTRAPFWKKEHTTSGDYWVSSRTSDAQAAARWENN